MDEALNPGSRPRRGVAAALGAAVTAALIGGALVLGGATEVQASGLDRFDSCEALSAWGAQSRQAATANFDEVGAPIGGAASPATTVAAGRDASASSAEGGATSTSAATSIGDDATNVVVKGIDEPDLVERLGADRALVVGGATLAVVDLAAATVESSAAVPYGAQVTYDADARIAWAVGSGPEGGVRVQRFAVSAGALTADGSWTTPGMLVSARRDGGELLVVATDGFPYAAMEGTVGSSRTDPGADGSSDASVASTPGPSGDEPTSSVPFAGGPVPCDQVLHPDGPSDPTATLLAVLPVRGQLTPVRATEVVGAGSLVHVTPDAAYLATPRWDPATGAASTGVHRFDLATLTHTGSGQVMGSMLNDFSMSEHDGYLRVAVTIGNGFTVMSSSVADAPVTTEPELSADGGAAPSAGSGDTAVPPPPATGSTTPGTTTPGTTTPETTVPVTVPGNETTTVPVTGTTVPTTVPGNETTTVPVTGTTIAPVPGNPVPEPTVVEPVPVGDALNEVVVLDTDGNLDVVGRTARFGHPGETLRGIRFDGPVAYGVTFLNTDPFYVLDLSEPTSPRVQGEVELPGFSSYLHPVSATQVVGFGPDETGRAAARLFDVSDPARPKVVDTVALGDESPVTSDHHAFVSLGGGRFAVPASIWSPGSGPCDPAACEPAGPAEPACDPAACETMPAVGVQSSVVVLSVSDGRLVVEQRHTVQLAESATRVIPTSDGWGLVAGSTIAVVDGAGKQRATITLP